MAYIGKRQLDLVLLASSAPLTVPVIAIAAAAIWIFDGRPVLFKQQRAGLHGEPFNILKFRTMKTHLDLDLSGLSPSAQITKSDTARITPVGRVLRKTSLDELPQLFNVLRGEMSLVGPRPLFMRYTDFYNARELKRLEVLPGITGHSQVSHRNQGGWRERLEYDVQYVEHSSIIFDLKLIAKTVLKAIRSEGVAIVAGDTGDALDDERSFPKEDGLSMRRVYSRDLPTRVKWLTDPQVRQHMTLGDNITLESTSEWHKAVRANPSRRDYVFETETGKLAAMSGVKAGDAEEKAEFYIFVNPDLQGRSIGTKATRLTLSECKREGKFKSIWLSVRKENQRALKIYERMGFQVAEETADRYAMQIELSDK